MLHFWLRNHVIAATCVASLLASSQPANAWSAASGWFQAPGARVRLIAASIPGGNGADRVFAGVQMQLDKGWKTYWRTPGDAGGIPPELDFEQSVNLKAGPILYPAPHRSTDTNGTSLVYSDEVVFPVEIRPEDPAAPPLLKANVLFGVCLDVCVPVETALALDLVDQPGAEAGIGEKLMTYLRRVPHKMSMGARTTPTVQSIKARLTGPAPEIIIEARYASAAAQSGDLFVEIEDGTNIAIPAKVSLPDDAVARFRVDLAKTPNISKLKGKVARITLVSKAEQSETEWRIE